MIISSAAAGADGPARVAFYVGGFEAVGGIEAFLFDVLTNLPNRADERSMLVWSHNLPEFREIEREGTKVLRTPLRAGCRFGLPDRLLYARHGRALSNADRIVFAKIPPEDLFTRIVDKARARRPMPTETVFVTPYRPREMWPQGMPNWVRRGFDRIMVQGEEFAQDLREMAFEGPIDIVPYIPPPAAQTPVRRSTDGPFRLGFLGRFVAQKNLFYLLDIVEELQPNEVEVHLFGGGEHDAELQVAVRERALPVTFHGVVPRENVPSAIESCDAFINPSISEGQCLVALEVLSRGRPFLATGVGAIPEILGKGRLGKIIPLDDAAGAATVINAFLSEWRGGAWNAREVAQTYARAYPREEIISAYASLL